MRIPLGPEAVGRMFMGKRSRGGRKQTESAFCSWEAVVTGIRFFVDLADQADAKLKEIDEATLKEMRFYKEQMENNKQQREPADVKLKTGLKLATLGVSYASIVAASFVAEGMIIDVMRIGEGWDQGNLGKAQDLLRGLAILGPVVKAAGTGARIATPALSELAGLVKVVDFDRRRPGPADRHFAAEPENSLTRSGHAPAIGGALEHGCCMHQQEGALSVPGSVDARCAIGRHLDR